MASYLPVAFLCLLSALVVGAMVSLNRLLGPPSGSAWRRFTVRFYMTAILFIVFDVEVVFLYPWALRFRELGLFGFFEMLVFLLVLGVGLLYAWRKGALEWE
jgi:NADH-quinone oxidoreductase subunit A